MGLVDRRLQQLLLSVFLAGCERLRTKQSKELYMGFIRVTPDLHQLRCTASQPRHRSGAGRIGDRLRRIQCKLSFIKGCDSTIMASLSRNVCY